MKNTRTLAFVLLTLAASAVAFAAKPLAGPKGGRILTTEVPHAEFFVSKERAVVISFYGADLKPLPLSGQTVSATAETKGGKVKLEFSEKSGALVSSTALPAGDDFTVVVQIKDNATARPKNYRVVYHDEICGECKRAEYACICAEGGEKEKGHKH